jgi:hypothetical protein
MMMRDERTMHSICVAADIDWMCSFNNTMPNIKKIIVQKVATERPWQTASGIKGLSNCRGSISGTFCASISSCVGAFTR